MSRFNNMVERLSLASGILAAGLLLTAVLTITWMVFYRTAGYQNTWELEASIAMMVAAAFLGSAYTLKTKGHVGMELLDAVLSERSRKKLAVVGQFLGFSICLYLVWVGAHLTVETYVSGERGLGMSSIPEWPKYAAMPIGMGLTALQYIVEIQNSMAAKAIPGRGH
jgi:TRAP-type C4-dicarboxylate transport system permease small subunit